MAHLWPLLISTENLAYFSIFSVITAVLCAICGYLYLKRVQNKIDQVQVPVLSANGSGDNDADSRINDSE
jgi:hypothetical protein